mgnify:CR=1 FL=1
MRITVRITLNNKELSVFGIVISCLIVGFFIILTVASPTTAIYGCGSGTYYHNDTNSCEIYPKKTSEKIVKDESQFTISIDDQGNKICPKINTTNWDLDKNCNVILKQP